MLNPEQIELLEGSFAEVLPMADAVADAFYAHLFAAAPELRPLFTHDLAEQRYKFLVTLQAIVGALWRPDALIGQLRALGLRHHGYGVVGAHYAPVGAALLAALGEQLGPHFTPAVAAAWAAAYALIAEAMLAGAA